MGDYADGKPYGGYGHDDLVRADEQRKERGPLNCPKGYGFCWTCSVGCDRPDNVQVNKSGGNHG